MPQAIPASNLTNISKLSWVDKTPDWATAPVLDGNGSTHTDFSYLAIEGHKLRPGGVTQPHAHKEHFELVLVWSGTGTLRYGDGQTQSLKSLDTAAIPNGVLHRFEQTGAEDLVLLSVHALNDKAVETTSGKFEEQPVASVPDPRSIKALSERSDAWEKPEFRAKRIRIWGREAGFDKYLSEPNEKPKMRDEPDAIKQQLQFTLYTFAKTQENPGHFHPHSVEFVVALNSGVKFMIRPKHSTDDKWDTFAQRMEHELQAGDLALVPMAAWHRYINGEKEDALVLAMQTPHPIMHTLLVETDGSFNPNRQPD